MNPRPVRRRRRRWEVPGGKYKSLLSSRSMCLFWCLPLLVPASSGACLFWCLPLLVQVQARDSVAQIMTAWRR